MIPDDPAYLLTTDHIGHVSLVRANGSIATTLMWVDWDGEQVLTSSPMGTYKGRRWRANPSISVSVVDHEDDWRFVTVDAVLPADADGSAVTLRSAHQTARAARR